MSIHNLCTTCGKDFGSVGAFDAHRVGKHEYLFAEGLKMNPPREDGRRCLDTEEMTGGESPRFTLTARGIWSLTRDLERGLAFRQTAGRPR
jgi:hypothetical protein